MYIFRNIYLYWIYAANSLGNICQLNVYVVIGYIMLTLGWLEGFCVPFGHRVRECIFLKMYICIGYVMPTIWGVYVT